MLDEVDLVLGVFELGSNEHGEFGGEREIVGDRGAFNNVSRSLGVAEASVMSGTICPSRVLGCNKTLSMSLVDTARVRLLRP